MQRMASLSGTSIFYPLPLKNSDQVRSLTVLGVPLGSSRSVAEGEEEWEAVEDTLKVKNNIEKWP